MDHPKPYISYGNGSAMRAPPIGWAFDSPGETFEEAEKSAAITPITLTGKRRKSSLCFNLSCKDRS